MFLYGLCVKNWRLASTFLFSTLSSNLFPSLFSAACSSPYVQDLAIYIVPIVCLVISLVPAPCMRFVRVLYVIRVEKRNDNKSTVQLFFSSVSKASDWLPSFRKPHSKLDEIYLREACDFNFPCYFIKFLWKQFELYEKNVSTDETSLCYAFL